MAAKMAINHDTSIFKMRFGGSIPRLGGHGIHLNCFTMDFDPRKTWKSKMACKTASILLKMTRGELLLVEKL